MRGNRWGALRTSWDRSARSACAPAQASSLVALVQPFVEVADRHPDSVGEGVHGGQTGGGEQ